MGFEGDAAFFDIMSKSATDKTDRIELTKVVNTYRKLAKNSPFPTKERTRADGWRMRAEECRTLAEQFKNPQCQAQLQRLAAAYEKMASEYDGGNSADIFF